MTRDRGSPSSGESTPVRYRIKGTLPDQIAELARLLRLMVGEATWPTVDEQGRAQAMVAWDLQDYCCGLGELIRAGSWSSVLVMFRPIQERFECLFAATVDPVFARNYLKRGREDDEPARIRAGEARSILRRQLAKTDLPLADATLLSHLNALGWGSASVHPTIDSASISMGLGNGADAATRENIVTAVAASGHLVGMSVLITYMSVIMVGGTPSRAARYAMAEAMQWLIDRGIATPEEIAGDRTIEYLDPDDRP